MTWLKQYIRSEAGIAGLEFALAAPLLVALLVGSIETLRYMLIHQKVEKVAYTMADLATQDDTLTQADMNDYYLAPKNIMSPMSFTTNGLVIITSVYRAVGDPKAKVRWRSTGGGTLSRSSKIGAVGQIAVLPNNLALNEKDNVLVAEVFYEYHKLLLPDGVISSSEDIYKTAVFKPRLGALLSAPQ